MGKLDAKGDYESLRNARISDNKARMESLGIRRRAGELNLITSPSRSRKDYTNTPERTKRARKSKPLCSDDPTGQKKLCGEEDCRRCGDRDSDQPCIAREQGYKSVAHLLMAKLKENALQ
uniref:Uncharacterized protein n=1 Tax=Ananas comosus var. bracteatus TaxID=296719 RepID=A0A6V7PP19_ANACO|nr:unnamed protein product [Ananas comosus var. bracteatus]